MGWKTGTAEGSDQREKRGGQKSGKCAKGKTAIIKEHSMIRIHEKTQKPRIV